MINLFCGYDDREAQGFHVFASSVIRQASRPVALIPLASLGLPHGSNAFTLSRFLIPWLMGFKGHAIFADASDMLMLADVSTLDMAFDPRMAVQVVKHADYQTRNPVKYIGTPMQAVNRDYPRKNWASLMLINCEHPAWRDLRPHTIAESKPLDLLQLRFCADSEIGELPDCWNRLADEGQPVAGARLLHWTAGIPGFECYRNAPGAEYWHAEAQEIANG